MKIKRIGVVRGPDVETNRIEFEHDGEKYTVTPEVCGFRVHKHSLDDGLKIQPACHNEIIIK